MARGRAQYFFKASFGSPARGAAFAHATHMNQQLLRDAKARRLTKQALADLLNGDRQQRFLNACAVIEKQFTEACTASARRKAASASS